MKNLLKFVALAVVMCVNSQNFEYEGSVSTTGIGSSEDTLPFWMYTNSETSINVETNFSGTAESYGRYTYDNVIIEVGVALFYRDGLLEDELQRRDLYVRFSNKWLKGTLGARSHDVAANGLSATNKDFLWSTNSRPLPGLLIEANEPLKINNTFAIDWGIAHYSLNDERYVDNPRVHYKRLGVIMTFNDKNKLKAQIQHYAQWAGTSPDYGPLNSDLDAFLSVFFANKASEIDIKHELLNAVGNHLGSYLVDYEVVTPIGDLSVYHEHPFEDGSGTGLQNFPDGLWGVHFMPKSTNLITSILYEYIDTSDQSGTSSASGIDGYFGNGIYRSGWSYEQNVIGFPFILYDRNIELTPISSPYISNRVKVHHLGVKGAFKKIEWTLKTTIARSLGTYRKPYDSPLNSSFNYASLSYSTKNYGTIAILGAVDFSNLSDTNVGGGVTYKYDF